MGQVKGLKNLHCLIKAAKNEIPVNESFLSDLNACMEKTSQPYTPTPSYKPSSLNCLRNMYYQIIGQPVEASRESAELISIGESGTDRHLRLQSWITKMQDMGIDCEWVDVSKYIEENNLDYLEVISSGEYETKLYHKTLNLRFLCDGIIRYKGEYYILEIKTETSYKWTPRKQVAEEHINQGTCYATAFNINKVIFLYECRDFCSRKAFLLEVTDDMKMERVVSRIEECDGYVAKLTPPPVPNNFNTKGCEYCGYRKECRKVGPN